jgi:hypothetical protein
MSEVNEKEVKRLERRAWWETERSQTACYRMMDLEDQLAEAREAYEKAEAKENAAWAKVYERFGGDRHRYWDWSKDRGE